jgi:ssDNA-binding Zn-finger/Zn-ribbon topoisomerase 1
MAQKIEGKVRKNIKWKCDQCGEIDSLIDDPQLQDRFCDTCGEGTMHRMTSNPDEDENEVPKCPTCDKELDFIPAWGGRIMIYECPICHEQWDEDSEEIVSTPIRNPEKRVIGWIEYEGGNFSLCLKTNVLPDIKKVTYDSGEVLQINIPKGTITKLIKFKRGTAVLGLEMK